jgi:hypothetical protein
MNSFLKCFYFILKILLFIKFKDSLMPPKNTASGVYFLSGYAIITNNGLLKIRMAFGGVSGFDGDERRRISEP